MATVNIVEDIPPRAQYVANQGDNSFTYAFSIFADTDLQVYKTIAGNIADDLVDILVLSVDYTVTGGDGGGTVDLVNPANAGDTITITRAVPAKRTSDYQTAGDFLASTVNNDFDKIVMMVQQVKEFISTRILGFNQSTNLIGVSTVVPSPEPLKAFRWNATATALEATDDPALSAGKALASEVNAKASEDAALISENNAANTFDEFDDRYLGSKASDPLTDNDGDPLITGALYWNNSPGSMRVYSGSGWVQAYNASLGIADTATSAQLEITNLGVDITGEVTDNLLMSVNKGLDLSNNPGTVAPGTVTTSRILNFYEEGTWSPVVEDESGNSATLLNNNGWFTRVGNKVDFSCYIRLNGKGSMVEGDFVRISGLPYNIGNYAFYTPTFVASRWFSLTTAVVMMGGIGQLATNYFVISRINSSQTNTATMTVSYLSGTSQLMFTGTYFV